MPKKQLTEAAPHAHLEAAAQSGRFRIQIMSAGQGSSGYYPASTLESAAKARIFPAGTHLYIDHPGATERDDRPERTLRDLVGVLASDAEYNPETRALEADATIYSQWRDVLVEMASDIGMSIRAWANSSPGEAEGHKGLIVWDLIEALSVDFVTKAGRDGKILAVLESARTATEAAVQDRREQLRRVIRDAQTDPDRWSYVLDFDEARHLVWYEVDNACYEQAFTPADDDMSVTLTGDRIEVRPITTYHPVTPAGPNPIPTKEAYMPQIEEARLAELTTAADRVPTLESERDAAVKRADEAEAKLADAAKTAYEAQVDAALTGSTLPEQAKGRVRESLTAGDIPADPTAAIDSAIKAEADYLAAVAPAPRKGLGFNAADESTATEAYANPWGRTIKPKGA